jgi:hypothetical protein
VFLQESNELSLEIAFLMMLVLAADVGEGGPNLRRSDREGTAVYPAKWLFAGPSSRRRSEAMNSNMYVA